jgi:hypothetical protein
MTTPTTRCMVPFTLTNVNVFELLAGFMPAAVSVGWSKDAVMQTVDEAMSGDYAHLHATLSEWCLPAIAYRAN